MFAILNSGIPAIFANPESHICIPRFWDYKKKLLNNTVYNVFIPCPSIDSIMRLMTVWRITGKIIRNAIFDTYRYAQL